ncbi:SagB/ThcOx family dehydrogenase [Thermocoleostomius sinensis]|uniref:SagB/ThcOx family dehydrogenase n=1 Tax=Thermocoleostomius sinensis A174 TaxID=2016057 RepID=A0A9E8ZFZ6_9CYAN|nr:SagB/ThcOx family dehydrogenase [Thermocoleostomius sinensis]WAL60653.1 SagB/ThcOx family dehydrogenase [Thermocoleostomius sinensis A174]
MPDPRISIAQHYHERTKYHPETIADQDFDWTKQPAAFKEYRIGTGIDLKSYLTNKAESTAEQDEWRRLSRFLFYSYGLTVGMVTRSGEPVYFRTTPSAGALYPAELYLVSRGTTLLPAGLYNYQAQTHSLLRFWDSEVWVPLQHACFWHSSLDCTHLALIVTTVFMRSAWRYRDRAYRRIFLDSGHLLGNIELASALTSYRPHLIGGFIDDALNQLLYLDVEQEGAIVAIALSDRFSQPTNPTLPSYTALPSSTQTDYPAIPDDELLRYFHHATAITEQEDPNKKESASSLASIAQHPSAQLQEDKYNFPFCLKVSTATEPIDWGNDLELLEKTIVQRRSTRTYSGANLSLDELKALLDFTYQPQHYQDQQLDPTPDYFDLKLIETFIAVSGVDGLDEGCYYYAPYAQELRQIRFKNFRRQLHRLCLGQNLGRDAAAVLFHTADLQAAVATYGDRVYRYLHLDAGHLGQRLNLAAIRLGLGVSGIAGFFDDEVNEVLGIPADEAVLYITTLGRPR